MMPFLAYLRLAISLPIVVWGLAPFIANDRDCFFRRRGDRRMLRVHRVQKCADAAWRKGHWRTSALPALAAFLVLVVAADVGAQNVERDLGDITENSGQETISGTLSPADVSHWYRFTVNKSDVKLVVDSANRGVSDGEQDTDMCIYSGRVLASDLDAANPNLNHNDCEVGGRVEHINGSQSSRATEYELGGAGTYFMRIVRGYGNSVGNQGSYEWSYWVSTPGVVVSDTDLTVNEGEQGSYTVRVTSVPQGTVTIAPQSSNGDVTVSPTRLTFHRNNWTVPQTVTVTVREDADTSDETAMISHTVRNYGNIATADTVTVTVTDVTVVDPGVVIGPRNLDVPEGSSGTYTVVLKSPPASAATVTLTSDNPDVSVSPPSLSFTSGNWQTPQRVSVTVSQDDDGDDETATIRHAVSGYEGVTAGGAVSVRIADTAPVLTPRCRSWSRILSRTSPAAWSPT